MKHRLDHLLAAKNLVKTRSQAESYIKLGRVTVDGEVINKPGHFVSETAKLNVKAEEQYVSRAGMKLASVAKTLQLDFKDKVVLDVGSSTGGFTDYALKRGAKKVIAVDVGTHQLHESLRSNSRVELHEKTDIRDVLPGKTESRVKSYESRKEKDSTYVTLQSAPDIVLIDVSFISLRDIIPHVSKLMTHDSVLIAMLKPQFEAGKTQVNKGIIKNDTVRRQILKNFELWVRQYAVVKDKADSDVAGAKGNRERFYILQKPSS